MHISCYCLGKQMYLCACVYTYVCVCIVCILTYKMSPEDVQEIGLIGYLKEGKLGDWRRAEGETLTFDDILFGTFQTFCHANVLLIF